MTSTTVHNVLSLPAWKKPGRLILPDDSVYVGRYNPRIIASGPVDFGNPFSHKKGAAKTSYVCDVETAISYHRRWLEGDRAIVDRLDKSYQDVRRAVIGAIPGLAGKKLYCWCAPSACHGHLLAFWADHPLRRPAP